ncbi:hypothetical protein AB0M28_10980 [Streptomyces sp. NPDC051940]|uniref:coiled-coil domain-containing protein n=1 Tax=Streptomyces sp. NPDC051940 TaxID=3155675 RepID=UPI003435BDC4
MRRPLPLVVLCTALLVWPTGSAVADPGDPPAALPAGGVLGRFQKLYAQKESAAAEYAALSEKLDAQRAAHARADGELALAREELAEGRRKAGVLAREQYRGTGGFSPYLAVLLSRDPQTAFGRAAALARASEHQAAILRELYLAERRLDQRATTARTALDKARGLAEQRREQGRKVAEQIAEVEELLASLSPDEAAAADRTLRGD